MFHSTFSADARPRLTAPLARKGFELCLSTLAEHPDFIRSPLVRHLKNLERAYSEQSPDTAFHARQLHESVQFIEQTMGASLGQAGRCISEFVGHLISLQVIEGQQVGVWLTEVA